MDMVGFRRRTQKSHMSELSFPFLFLKWHIGHNRKEALLALLPMEQLIISSSS